MRLYRESTRESSKMAVMLTNTRGIKGLESWRDETRIVQQFLLLHRCCWGFDFHSSISAQLRLCKNERKSRGRLSSAWTSSSVNCLNFREAEAPLENALRGQYSVAVSGAEEAVLDSTPSLRRMDSSAETNSSDARGRPS
jgi:hypothetical protein